MVNETRITRVSTREESEKRKPKEGGEHEKVTSNFDWPTGVFRRGVSTGRGQVVYAPEPTAITTGTPPPGVVETYKVVNGMNIRATVFNVDDSTTHRVAIVIHGGGYSGGVMETSVAQELSQYGFMGVAIEYRLAPP